MKQKSVMVLTLSFEHVSAMDAEVILVRREGLQLTRSHL